MLITTSFLHAQQPPADSGRGMAVTPGSAAAKPGQKWALVVGINDYTNLPKLRYARQDAEAIARTLVGNAGFARENVVLMTDKLDDPACYATRGNLRNRINQLATVAEKNDLLLVCFAGHGLNVDGSGYLVPVDGAQQDIGSLIPLSWVKTTLETSNAKHRLLVLDACHAGARAGPEESAAQALLSQVSSAAFLTLASCDSRQLSHEDEQAGQGVFTSAVIAGLSGRADQEGEGNKDGVVTVEELFHYASLSVKRWCLQSGKLQTPVLRGELRERVELARVTRPGEAAVVRVEPAPMPTPPSAPSPQVLPAVTPAMATKENPFINSLGMKFVPVPGTTVLFCIWETRVRDYAAYASANPGVDGSWQNAVFESVPVSNGPDYPVVNVSWDDARAFCRWLTQKERDAGRIGPGQEYRLPTDLEWSAAVGLANESGITPKERSEKVPDVYPWGTQWPPPRGAGNYADQTAKTRLRGSGVIEGYDDGYATTAPVGSFAANQFGIFDLGGNVWEWCEDFYDGQSGARVMRGASWDGFDREYLLSSRRFDFAPGLRGGRGGFRCVVAGAGGSASRRP